MTLNGIQDEVKKSFQLAIESGQIKLENVRLSPYSQAPLIQLSEIDRFGLSFGTYLCQDTGLIITSPRLSDKTIAYYYQHYYHPLNYGRYDIEEVKSLFMAGQGAKIWRFIKPYLNFYEKKTISVLEIGVGLGDVLSGLKDCAKDDGIQIEAIGTEFNYQCIQKTSEKNIQVIYGGLDAAVELDKRYHIVIMSHVFEHLLDLQDAMKKLHSLLLPDGLLFIEVPGVLTLHRRLVYSFDYVRYTTHAHCYNFNLTSLAYVLGQEGFNLISGNEECEALFERSNKNEKFIPEGIENNSRYIYGYLRRLKNDYNFYQKQAQDLNCIRLLKNRIEYLEKIYYSPWLSFRHLIGLFLPKSFKAWLEK